MENNEPLLKDEKEELNVALSETNNDSDLEESEDSTNQTSEAKSDAENMKEENNFEVDYQVEEKYKKEVIKPLKEDAPKEVDEQPKPEKKKKNTASLVITIILVMLVSYLLAQTCINFYYGFKYKNYVPENNTTQQP